MNLRTKLVKTETPWEFAIEVDLNYPWLKIKGTFYKSHIVELALDLIGGIAAMGGSKLEEPRLEYYLKTLEIYRVKQ